MIHDCAVSPEDDGLRFSGGVVLPVLISHYQPNSFSRRRLHLRMSLLLLLGLRLLGGRLLRGRHVEVEEMFPPEVKLQIDVRSERSPAVQAEEGELAGVREQVVLEADGDLEDGLALGAYPVLRVAVLVNLSG